MNQPTPPLTPKQFLLRPSLCWTIFTSSIWFSIGLYSHQVYWSEKRTSYEAMLSNERKIISNYQLTLSFHTRTIDSLRRANEELSKQINQSRSVANQ